MGHKCSSCNGTGHGQIECGNTQMIQHIVKLYSNDKLLIDKQCKFGDCHSKEYHTNDAHFCLYCYGIMHSAETCPISPVYQNDMSNQIPDIVVDCPLCKQTSTIKNDQQLIRGASDTCVVCMDKSVEVYFPKCGHVCVCVDFMEKLNKNPRIAFDVFDSIRNEQILVRQSYDINYIKSHLKNYPSYIIIYEGMGCVSLIRRLKNSSKIEGLFNHSDDHYLPIKMSKIKDFTAGYCCINDEPIMSHEWRSY